MEEEPIHFIIEAITGSTDAEDENDVNIEQYIIFWTHVCRMMTNWGAVFNFVVRDVQQKIKELEEMRVNDVENYKSIQTMAKFEESSQIIRRPKPNRSGTSLVRVLNRALEFIVSFLNGVYTAPDPDVRVSGIAKNSYDLHLSSLHGWPVRTAASAAVLTLPRRLEFLTRLRGSAPAENDAKFFEAFTENGRQIISRVNNLAIQFNISDHNPSS